MRRGHDDVELQALLERDVDLAIREDVRLDSLQQPKPRRMARIELGDLLPLHREPLGRDASGDAQAGGVVGDCRIRISPGHARGDDVVERLGAIAPGGVHLQIAPVVLTARPRDCRIVEHGADPGAAQEPAAPLPPPRDLYGPGAAGHGSFHRGRRAGVEGLENHPRRMKTASMSRRRRPRGCGRSICPRPAK